MSEMSDVCKLRTEEKILKKPALMVPSLKMARPVHNQLPCRSQHKPKNPWAHSDKKDW